MVAKGWGQGVAASWYSMGMQFQVPKMRRGMGRMLVSPYNSVNVPNATELDTFPWLRWNILNFTTI